MDLISVIIPTYNREKYINSSIMSVLNQTYSNIEVIIVDDGSTDKTEKVVRSIRDSRLIYIKLKKNRGACYARNYGIKIAKGEYIAFHDSDDIFHEDKLEKQLNNLIDNKSDLDFCRQKVYNGDLIEDIPTIDKRIQKGDWVLARLCKGNIIGTPAILAKKEIFENVLFDEKLPRLQDYDFVLRVASNYKISYTNDVLIDHFINSDSISNNDTKLRKACLYMLRKNYGLDDNQQSDLSEHLLWMCTAKIAGDLEWTINKCHNLEDECNILKQENKQLKSQIDNIINIKRWKILCKILKIFGK